MLIQDDCLNALRNMQSESVDMIYLDPPFFSQKKQTLRNVEGKEYSFSDCWNSKEAYLAFMKERLIVMRSVLKKEGTIFLHCDTTASHSLKLLMDDIFGEENFQSEIIWSYKRWSNSRKGLLPGHQTIFFYSKTKGYKFHTLYHDYSATTNLDQILQERERSEQGKSQYRRDEQGNIVFGKEKQGVPMSDVWEIPFLNPKAKERVGYPTQKPIELLERILKISTDEGDLVLDPFCGSGTTLVAAELMGRRFIGIDSNPEAIALSRQRIAMPTKTESRVLQLGEKEYRAKSEKELAILKQFECNVVQRNKGIDGILKKYYLNAPVALKIQKEQETVLQAAELLKNAGSKRKCSFLILIANRKLTPKEEYQIPSNMIVLKSYQSEFEEYAEQFCWKEKKA